MAGRREDNLVAQEKDEGAQATPGFKSCCCHCYWWGYNLCLLASCETTCHEGSVSFLKQSVVRRRIGVA